MYHMCTLPQKRAPGALELELQIVSHHGHLFCVCGLSTFVFQESPFLNFSFPLVSHFYPTTACMLGKNSLPELHQPSRS